MATAEIFFVPSRLLVCTRLVGLVVHSDTPPGTGRDWTGLALQVQPVPWNPGTERSGLAAEFADGLCSQEPFFFSPLKASQG